MALIPRTVTNVTSSDILIDDFRDLNNAVIHLLPGVPVDLLSIASEEDIAKSFHLKHLASIGAVTVVATFDAIAIQTSEAEGGELAGSLETTSNPVDISLSTPPTAGQVLTATDATHANWQSPSSSPADASTTVKGVSKLSVAPVLNTNPIAVGDNDPRNSDSRAPEGPAGGDLTGSYPNPTVATVGTSSAANIHNTELAVSAATELNTPNELVKRDGSGNFAAGQIEADSIGVGTPTPVSALEVASGWLSVTGGGLSNSNSLTLSNETTYMWIQSWDNKPLVLNRFDNHVGIAKIDPAYTLDIGATTDTPAVRVYDGSKNIFLTINSDASRVRSENVLILSGDSFDSLQLDINGVTIIGNLASINTVPYVWPITQGGSSTSLTNDGSGNLSWAPSSSAPASPSNSVQFNSSGSFGGSSQLIFDPSAGFSPGKGNLNIGNSPTTNVTLSISADTNDIAGPGGHIYFSDDVNASAWLRITATPYAAAVFESNAALFLSGSPVAIPSGTVLIGEYTNSSSASLDVVGDINTTTQFSVGGVVFFDGTNLTFNGDLIRNGADGGWQMNGGDIIRQSGGGTILRLGIGPSSVILAAGGNDIQYLDGPNSRVGILQPSPAYTVDVAGDVNVTGTFRVGGVDVITSAPRWVKVATLGFGDFATGANTNTITLFTLPASGIIQGLKIKQSTEFTGGAISAYTLSVGLSGDHVKYTPSPFDVFQAAGDTIFLLQNLFVSEDQANPTTVVITADSTGDTLDQAGQGSADIWVLYATAV